MDTTEYMNNLTDAELRQQTLECVGDLAKAAEEYPNTEWHEACFAALVLFSGEWDKRQIKLAAVH